MLLGPVSYLDCLVFLVFLAPQLLLNVGLIETVVVVLQALPFFRTYTMTRLPIAHPRYRNPRLVASPASS